MKYKPWFIFGVFFFFVFLLAHYVKGALPPPSEATLKAYAAPAKDGDYLVYDGKQEKLVWSVPAKVYPKYVFRVWTADWCPACRSSEWRRTIRCLDAIPLVGVTWVNYDRFRPYARKHGITALPAVQLFEVRDGKLKRVVAVRVGRLPFTRLRRLLPCCPP